MELRAAAVDHDRDAVAGAEGFDGLAGGFRHSIYELAHGAADVEEQDEGEGFGFVGEVSELDGVVLVFDFEVSAGEVGEGALGFEDLDVEADFGAGRFEGGGVVLGEGERQQNQSRTIHFHIIDARADLCGIN